MRNKSLGYDTVSKESCGEGGLCAGKDRDGNFSFATLTTVAGGNKTQEVLKLDQSKIMHSEP